MLFLLKKSRLNSTLLLIAISYHLLAETASEDSCLTLNLTNAISRALNDNRQLMNITEDSSSTEYAIELANSEFEIQFSPNSRAGYVGGGHAGTGWSVGGGLDISKKWVTGTQFSVVPSILKFPKHYHTEINAIFSQPLLRGLGKEYQLSGILSAQFAKRTAYRNLYSAQVKLILQTVRSCYEIAKAEKTLTLNRESYDRIEKFYKATKLKEKIGLSDSLDIYRAETELRCAEDCLKDSEDRLHDAEDVLRELLSLPFDTEIKVDIPLVFTPLSIQIEDAIKLALENRIEIDQDEDQANENRRLARIAKQNLNPELNLVLNYTNCGRNEVFTRACTRHRESTWGIGLTTSTSFDPLAERIAYEQCLIAVTHTTRSFEQTEALLILDVKRVFRLLKRANQRVQLQKEQIYASEGEICLAKLKFNHGMTDHYHVLQAEKNLRMANQTYWDAIIDHIVGEFELLAAIGLLIDKPKL